MFISLFLINVIMLELQLYYDVWRMWLYLEKRSVISVCNTDRFICTDYCTDILYYDI